MGKYHNEFRMPVTAIYNLQQQVSQPAKPFSFKLNVKALSIFVLQHTAGVHGILYLQTVGIFLSKYTNWQNLS